MAEVQDKEITLGTGRLLGLFFGLVIVCAVFFGLGFSMGRNSIKSGTTLEEAPAATRPIANNPGQKLEPGTPDRTAPSDTQSATANSSDEKQAAAPVVSSPATTPVANTAPPEMPRGLPLNGASTGSYAVQVAAVSKQEDADALVDALKKKSYQVFIASNASDKLFHVQVGPFGDIKDAEAMKAKLTGDGYNPIVKR
jgi:DedD protein